MAQNESVQDRPDPMPPVFGGSAVCHQVVVIPFHQHERVTGPDRLFEQPWGVEQVLAEAYRQLVSMGLLPYRRFHPGNDQWLYADIGTNQTRAERVAHHLDHQLQAMRLPLIAFAQTAVPERAAEELTPSGFPLK
ncbi:MAG TPA: hypothetical protein PKV72_05450 [Candidatus Peribacteria bacterium]|nr:hypothetical protein [Candidatus Peribacteria bacterium]